MEENSCESQLSRRTSLGFSVITCGETEVGQSHLKTVQKLSAFVATKNWKLFFMCFCLTCNVLNFLSAPVLKQVLLFHT